MSVLKLPQLRNLAKAEKWDRYIVTENDERALLAGYRVDRKRGDHVCKFFEKFLVHSKGRWAGKPFKLTDVQRHEIIVPLFGWVRPDGRRRFTTASIWVPKKNFKSTMAAGFALYGLMADGEEGAEIYCAAVDRKQAGIVFGEASNMVEASPDLRRRLLVTPSTKTIAKDSASWFKALSADYATHEGLNAHFRIVDEIHAFDERGRALVETLRYSGAARMQPLGITISTAGDDDDSIGYEEYGQAKAILSGQSEDIHSFAFIREAEPGDDPGDPATWAKANPSLGDVLREEELREEFDKAKGSPRRLESFKRYRLNLWIKTATPWLDIQQWQACAGEVEPEQGDTCAGGLDLSATQDLTALSLVFPADGVYRVMNHFWLPDADIVEKERRDRRPYRDYAERGYLTLTPGKHVDYSFVKRHLLALAERFTIESVAYDPYSATKLTSELEAEGLTMLPFRQGYLSMSPAAKLFERAILGQFIVHDDNPIMNWMIGHVVVTDDAAGNIKPNKAKSRKRIDGVVSTIMALNRAEAVAEQHDMPLARAIEL